MLSLLKKCELCPRKCGVDRFNTTGFCGVGKDVIVARAAKHFMEEPCISGEAGSGTIFFAGCNLKCCYCQNYQLSMDNFGKVITIDRLGEIMLELQSAGANNINLVTGVMYLPQICEAIKKIRNELIIPVVYNSGGYENPEIIEKFSEYIDIFLVDIKYYSDELSRKYSKADKYFENAMSSIKKMIELKGAPAFFQNKSFDDEDAILKSGVIIRHLVLPGQRKDSLKIIDEINSQLEKDTYILNVMSQFTPNEQCEKYKEINRKVTSFEYDSVISKVLEYGIEMAYFQERSSVGREYTPEFKLQGVDKVFEKY